MNRTRFEVYLMSASATILLGGLIFCLAEVFPRPDLFLGGAMFVVIFDRFKELFR